MSQFNAIGESGLGDVLTKRLTTPGGSNAPSVAPEIFPVLTLESDRPEWGYLKGEMRYSARALTGTPVAVSYSILRNPAGSKMLATVELISCVASAGEISVVLIPTGVLPLGSSHARGVPVDGRHSAFAGALFVKQSVCSIFNADAALVTNQESWRGASPLSLAVPFVVTPGMDLGFYGRTVGATLLTNLSWRERSAQPGELA